MAKNLVYDIHEKPQFSKLIVFAIQQLLAIIAATIAVPAIVGNGMTASAALFGAGVGTFIYLLFTKFRSPVFLGSSFAFIGSMFAAFGGAAGVSVMTVMRYGMARGIFSNEAGVGSAAITHASAKVNKPAEQAIWGPLEVFVDTFIVCLTSGLAIVLSGLWDSGLDGVALTMGAFQKLLPGNWGQYIVLGASILFGFSCLITYYNYLEKSCMSIFGPKCKFVIKVLWVGFIILGSYSTLGIVWDLADTCNGLIIIPNLIALVFLSKEVVKMKEEYYAEELPKYKAEKAAKK